MRIARMLLATLSVTFLLSSCSVLSSVPDKIASAAETLASFGTEIATLNTLVTGACPKDLTDTYCAAATMLMSGITDVHQIAVLLANAGVDVTEQIAKIDKLLSDARRVTNRVVERSTAARQTRAVSLFTELGSTPPPLLPPISAPPISKGSP